MIEVHVEVFGDAAVDQVQELPELDGPVAVGHVGDDLPRGHVECGVEIGGATADVVVGRRSGSPGRIGRTGAVRSSAWIWVFSSTHSTRAASGG